MVGVEPPAPPARTPIGARLAARGVRPRKVSAKRSWPRGCGRFPPAPPAAEAGDGEKGAAAGVIEGRVEEAAGHAVVSPAACNGDLPPAPPQAETEGLVEEKEEGGGADIATVAVSSAACNGDPQPAPPQPETEGLVEEKERGEVGIATKAVSSAACNGSLPQALPVPETEGVEEEMKDGGEEQLPDDGDVRSSNGLAESMAIEVMPLAFAAPHSFAVAVNGFVEIGGHGAESSLMESKGGLGSGQLVRKEDLTGNVVGGVKESRADDGELEREDDGHDAVRKKRWLMSAVNPPPKRRAVSAIRKFPPGCGRPAVTGTGSRGEEGLLLDATPISFATGAPSVADALHTIPASDHGASPVLMQDASNQEVEGNRSVVEGTNKAHGKIQESHVVHGLVPSDFAGRQHDDDSGCPPNAVAKVSPRHGFVENMNGTRLFYERKHVRKGEGSLWGGTTKVVFVWAGAPRLLRLQLSESAVAASWDWKVRVVWCLLVSSAGATVTAPKMC